MYKLTSENLTGLGGPMGTERTWNNWEKYFNDIVIAKDFALRDYRKETKDSEATIDWRDTTLGRTTDVRITSGDLRFVMYTIEEVKPIITKDDSITIKAENRTEPVKTCKIKQVIKYQAYDGKVFDTEEEAIRHEDEHTTICRLYNFCDDNLQVNEMEFDCQEEFNDLFASIIFGNSKELMEILKEIK
jgi:hypothetical protein